MVCTSSAAYRRQRCGAGGPLRIKQNQKSGDRLTMLTPEENAKIMRQATYLMWVSELNAMKAGGKVADWHKRRIAAQMICEMVGVADVIKAVARDGVLRPPPLWPEVDIVPVGGGPSMVTCAVRTAHKGKVLQVKCAMVRPSGGKKFVADQIAAALDRGKFELKRIITKQERTP